MKMRAILLVCTMCIPCGWAAAQGVLLFPNSDFEMGDLTNWRAEGEAFGSQPTLGDNVSVRRKGWCALPQGKYWVGTYENYSGKNGQKPGAIQGDKLDGAIISTGFIITHPYITFLIGGWNVKGCHVQLIVDGNVVLTEQGIVGEIMHRVFWDVSKYMNQKAMIYVVDHVKEGLGHINVDDFRFADVIPDMLPFPNSDFEMGDLSNWTAEGDAMAHQPTKGDNVAARTENKTSAGVQGNYWVGTSEHYQGKPEEKPGTLLGDQAKGTLRSILFTIHGKVLKLDVGGGKDPNVGVRLLVEGKEVRNTHSRDKETMITLLWDTSEFMGKVAELEIYDKSDAKWGHINVDNIRYGRMD